MLDQITPMPEPQKFTPDPAAATDKRPCCIVAELLIDEQNFQLDGILRWLVPNGALFREASRFILRRKGDAIRLRLLGEDYNGIIIGTSSQGYELSLMKRVPEALVAELVTRYATED
jgi:hypothetical protein